MPNQPPARRFLGITVLGDFILSEGAEAVLENLRRVGATAVACNPTVTVPAPEGSGSFQPPADAGSSPRVFDRPLWGRHSLWVRSGPSYRPNADFYRGSPYGPRQVNDLTDEYGASIGRFIDAAVDSGLKVYFQIGAAQPSKLRDDDRPRLPSGRCPSGRMADTASLASEAVRAYNRAYVHDLLAAYPQISGFRPDWPEYPCYTLDEVFQDFSPHVQTWAEERGFDYERIRRQVGELYEYLHGRLTNDDLRAFAGPDRGNYAVVTLLSRFPAVGEWLRLKAALSVDLLQHWRTIINEAGGSDRELSANAFMPPYSALTGFDFIGAAGCCHSIAPKLYTMHWSLMVKFWGDVLLEANSGLEERLVVQTLVNLMDLADSAAGHAQMAEYGYPNPDEPHPVPDAPQQRKIALARSLTNSGGAAAVYPLVHGYGPPDDFRRRLQLVADSAADGVWINRYGYLSDEKLAAIEAVWK
jgi:hypothetical protein